MKTIHTLRKLLGVMLVVCLVALPGIILGALTDSPYSLSLVVGASTLVAIQKNFKALFQSSFDAYEPEWAKFAMVADSQTHSENYQWLGAVPRMKEWVDEKSVEKLRGFQYTIINKDWEATIEVDRNDIEDDTLGLYRPRILELGSESKRHPDELVSLQRAGGENGDCYDGKKFHAANHVVGKSGTQTNIVTGGGVTPALVLADFRKARALMRTYKDDQGRPRIRKSGKLDLVAVIPPDLEGVFEELNEPAPGSTTPKLVIPYTIDPYLTSAGHWYLEFVSAPIKPYVLQMRKTAQFVELINPNTSDTVFMQKKFHFGVEARYNSGYGLWFYSVKVKNA
ncbi:MAG: Mu-like prophage major head subunit gpT family protein [Bacteroidota bacterium]